ncbi:RagB/SusD family nutrient uptake outer membrane protein [Pedobacter sp. N36a]|uniref:RagB/SusD family nutrient uptake outer membrane protein n=1 Tax=Pedobacter sp. N36a TaxID=2767996 RepID=UPI0016570C45|nr:RagB/SusD family nutrient uptake outer membrane protein [Pedobacter sp. N36a]MBC8987036.1 RagB/SusD family nutrient uptake outer membrane protein [Pedobacter sp. N36a]
MKRIYILTGLMAVIAFSSCKKQLDLKPFNAVTDEQALIRPSDFAAAARGMYLRMLSKGNQAAYVPNDYYGGTDNFNFIASNDILSDNAISYSGGRQTGLVYQNWDYNGLSTTNFYQDGYSIIRTANAILAKIDNLKDGSRADVEGQALAVRAIVHFDMLRLFGKTYTNASATDLGIPYLKTVQLVTDNPVRATVKSNYDQIRDDLEKAAGLIDDLSAVKAKGRLSRAAVYGYLSRVYLYRGEWDKCVTASSSALAINGDAGSLSEFSGIWKDATDAGVLFKLAVLDVNRLTPGTVLGQNARAEQVPAFDFYNLYKATDVRKAAYFTEKTNEGILLNYVSKYEGRASGNLNVVDIKLMRVAEVLLNRAEAYSNIPGNDGLALADLDNLRSKRYTDFRAGGERGIALQSAIALQRRLELAFEGDRFVDLKRKNLPVVRNARFGDSADGTGRPYRKVLLPAGSDKFQLPIDQISINASNGVLIQNPN